MSNHALNTPYSTFEKWMNDAKKAPEIKYPYAMHLSTIGEDGFPDGRVVLLMAFDTNGFDFFTDETSKKGKDLDANPIAALTFYWGRLDRQIRIRGHVIKLDKDISKNYFNERPRESQITAWASDQSAELNDVKTLKENYDQAKRRFSDAKTIPCPSKWRAFRLSPVRIEFWEAKSYRLHQRRVYDLDVNNRWRTTHLCP